MPEIDEQQIDAGSIDAAEGQATSEFSIPQEYSEKGWVKFFDGKTGDDLKAELFKSYDSQQSLIGKKVNEYLANTDLKQLDNFEEIKKTLLPQIAPEIDVPEKYNFDSVLLDEEGNKIYPMPDEALDEFTTLFKEEGINDKQAQSILKKYIEFETENFKKYTDADELEAGLKEMFKSNPSQRQTCESLIKEFLSADDQKLIQDTMPNVVVEMFYKVSKGLVDKYGYKETTGGQKAGSVIKTDAEKQAEYDKLYNQLIELCNRPHTENEKASLLKQLQNVFN
ncbi:MAG: hypothetical protein IJ301_02080 [Clostridia bacterium]|nr:hypothetical protein [Clostridia bacterium]